MREAWRSTQNLLDLDYVTFKGERGGRFGIDLQNFFFLKFSYPFPLKVKWSIPNKEVSLVKSVDRVRETRGGQVA